MVEVDREQVVLARAERSDDRLIAFESPTREASPSRLAYDAQTTLAVALATRGWPPLTAPEAWTPGWHGDSANPAGLADRVVCWEAAHDQGWRVETPRIPGLSYPTWSELQAQWDDERRDGS